LKLTTGCVLRKHLTTKRAKPAKPANSAASPKRASPKKKAIRENGFATSRDDTQIAYETIGTGPAVVLVDGAFCSRVVGPMPKLAALLAPDFKVYTYDRRGRNQSTDTPPYLVAKEIDDLWAVLAAAGGKAHIIGMSSGAVLALRALGKGMPAQSLTLYEPPFIVEPNPNPVPKDHREHLAKLLQAGRRADAVTYYLVKVIGMPEGYLAPLKRMALWEKLKAAAHTLPYDSEVMGDFRLPSTQLATIKTRTLVLSGERSPKLLRDAAVATAAALPNGRHVVLARQGHSVSPKAFAPVILDFLG